MIQWYHAIFSAYGFWLPNDPRGSWSDFVASFELYRYGGATKTSERRSLAHDPHNVQLRREAKQALKYPPVRFDPAAREAIARGIAQACNESDITVHACSIGYDHVHVVVARHLRTIENIVGQFKTRSSQQMKAAGRHPMTRFGQSNKPLPSPWSDGCWKVFIDDPKQLRCAVDYVDRHPEKEGLAFRRFEFVRRP